jgi:3-oxoacyl-[acyl-carrier-protein] synthase III
LQYIGKITDLTDRSTAVLFGDGAGAVVIGEVSEGRGIIRLQGYFYNHLIEHIVLL